MFIYVHSVNWLYDRNNLLFYKSCHDYSISSSDIAVSVIKANKYSSKTQKKNNPKIKTRQRHTEQRTSKIYKTKNKNKNKIKKQNKTKQKQKQKRNNKYKEKNKNK